jgi:hypothetical protein
MVQRLRSRPKSFLLLHITQSAINLITHASSLICLPFLHGCDSITHGNVMI